MDHALASAKQMGRQRKLIAEKPLIVSNAHELLF